MPKCQATINNNVTLIRGQAPSFHTFAVFWLFWPRLKVFLYGQWKKLDFGTSTKRKCARQKHRAVVLDDFRRSKEIDGTALLVLSSIKPRNKKKINRLNLSVESNTILRNCFNAHWMIGSEEKGKTKEQLSIVYVVHVVPAELLWKCVCVCWWGRGWLVALYNFQKSGRRGLPAIFVKKNSSNIKLF